MFIVVFLVVLYLLVLCVFRNRIIIQELLFLIIYISSVTYYQQLDIALPIYFLFSAFPFVPHIKKIKKITLIIAAFFGMYLIYGMMFQDIQESIVTFVSRCWQFVIFFCVYDCDLHPRIDFNSKKYFYLAIVFELVIATYLFFLNRNPYSVVRLTAGAQPVTGNVSVVILPLLCYCCYRNSYSTKRQTHLVFLMFCMAVMVGLSGTRGYELLYLVTMGVILWSYIIDVESNRRLSNRILIFVMSIAVLIVILFVVPQLFQRILLIFRINETSVGIRVYENKAGLEFMLNAPTHVKIFGVGIGGRLGDYPEYLSALYKQFSLGMWDRRHYLYDSGALFHNFYLNVLCNMGLVGMLVVIICIYRIWKAINLTCAKDRKIRIALEVYLIGFIIMNYYRWSSDCGIGMMIMLAIIMKAIQCEKNEYNPTI